MFEEQDDDVDLILNSLRTTLDTMYKDRTFLKELYKDPVLFKLAEASPADYKAGEKIEALKVLADELYKKFYKSAKYIRLMRDKVKGFKAVRAIIGSITNQLPVAPAILASRYEEADERGHFYDREELFQATEELDQRWDDPNFTMDDWIKEPPKFKKGFNSKFTKINMKDINPNNKKLDDYFNRKQVVQCTARNIITQPVRDILTAQLDELNLEEEKVPRSVYCVFDKDGRLSSL